MPTVESFSAWEEAVISTAVEGHWHAENEAIHRDARRLFTEEQAQQRDRAVMWLEDTELFPPSSTSRDAVPGRMTLSAATPRESIRALFDDIPVEKDVSGIAGTMMPTLAERLPGERREKLPA
jgi:hypothetical protein